MADILRLSPVICTYPDYSKGVLKVTLPYQQPFENAIEVKID
jgi:hypothetical protein